MRGLNSSTFTHQFNLDSLLEAHTYTEEEEDGEAGNNQSSHNAIYMRLFLQSWKPSNYLHLTLFICL